MPAPNLVLPCRFTAGPNGSYSKDETYNIPLAIAAKPGGGSLMAWMTGYTHTQNPHLVALGATNMLLTWGSGTGQAAQIYDTTTGAKVGSQFTVAAPDHPWQSWKPFPDGSFAWAFRGIRVSHRSGGTSHAVYELMPLKAHSEPSDPVQRG